MNVTTCFESFVLLAIAILHFGYLAGTSDHCDGQDGNCEDSVEATAGRWTEREHRCSNLFQHRPDGTRETQTWQRVPDRDVMIFSAFAERRHKAGGPAIRIIASGLQAAYNDIGHVFCQIWDTVSSSNGPLIVKGEYIRIYPSTLHADMWVAHFIICPVQDLTEINKEEVFVSVTPTPCEIPSTYLKLMGQNQKKTDTHALCLPNIYNKFSDWEMVVEMVELHKLLGADEITIYNQSLGMKVNEVLHYYSANDPIVNVVQYHFPVHLKSSVHCQRGTINDCLYRMGSKHKYVTISDLDEVLVPRGKSSTWNSLLVNISRPDRGSYSFQHAYFRRNDTGERPYLISQQSLWRTRDVYPVGKIRCKTMYNSDMAVSVDLHFAYELLEGATEYMLPPSEGILHHYRKDPMSSFQKNPDDFVYIEDKYMTKYGDILRTIIYNVHDMLHV